jgi:hypothetical protein
MCNKWVVITPPPHYGTLSNMLRFSHINCLDQKQSRCNKIAEYAELLGKIEKETIMAYTYL